MQQGHAVPSADFLDVFATNRTRLLKIARSILACPLLAEDVVQDAALKLTCAARPGPCIDCPLHFACRVVRNLALDHKRSLSSTLRRTVPEACARDIAAPGTDPLARLENGEMLHTVAKALRELPERTRQVFQAHRVDGVPQKEIARRLGVSPTLVNFMIRDAHNHCRRRLTGEDAPAPVQAHGRRPKAAPGRSPRAKAAGPRRGS